MGKVILWAFAALGAVFIGLFALALVFNALPPVDGQGGSQASGKSAKAEQRHSQPETDRGKAGMREAVKVAKAEETDAPLTAARNYYANVEQYDWDYTYNHLDSTTQGTYTYDDWAYRNESLASSDITYTIGNIDMINPNKAGVNVTLTFGDGSTQARYTYFVYEGSEWLHSFSEEEYNLLASVGGSASATAAASASASAPSDATSLAAPTSGEVNVKVVVSANKPVDVGIISAKDMGVPMITEQVQSKTYTFTKRPNADLTVSADDPNLDFNANDDIHIEVYENGQLKAEDSDDVTALVQY